MKTIKDVIGFISNLAVEHDTWQIAIRISATEKLYEGNMKDFSLIPNSFRYWRADPFIFKHNTKSYLFCEMYDRIANKGVIGVSEILNGECKGFKVCLSEKFHLSYPLVFKMDGEIFMLPECSESQRLTLYKSVEFPYKWKKEKTISKKTLVDTTPIFASSESIIGYLTTLFSFPEEKGVNNNLYWLSKDGVSAHRLYTGNWRVRPAGNIIFTEDKILRPAQDDTHGYGESLIFYKIENLDEEHYSEHEVLSVYPPITDERGTHKHSISVNNVENGQVYTGIHTYNTCKEIEVIDVSREKVKNSLVFLKNFKLYIKDKFRRH